MNDAYVVLGVFSVLAILFPAGPLIASQILAPRNPGALKSSPYECGTVESGDAWGQFKVQFYLYALIFLVFDVEALYLYPWAVVFKESGVTGFAEVAVFIALLLFAWAYAWRQGALEWE